MSEVILKVIEQAGVWAAISILLLWYVFKQNKIREEHYMSTIKDLSELYNSTSKVIEKIYDTQILLKETLEKIEKEISKNGK